MNDAKNNWFYKQCIKQAIKDSGWIFVGIWFIMLGVLAIIASDGILISLVIIGLGIAMIFIGGSSLFSKLPKLKERLEMMSPGEFESLGESAPQCINKTFYFTDRFLCSRVDYVIIPYESISCMTLGQRTYKGRLTGGHVTVEFYDGTPKMRLTVEDRKFMAESDAFSELVWQYNTRIEIKQ